MNNRLHLPATLLLLVFASLNQCLYGQISDSGQTITSGDLVLSFDQNGAIVRLVDAVSGTDYGVKKDHASLLGLISGSGQILSPDRFTFEDGLYQYRFAEGISVEVKADVTSDYITFEVVDFQNNSQQKIAAIFWRVDSSLRGTVAETAGIIYDDVFAVGLMGLNTKTSGGWFEVVSPPTPIDKWHDGGRQDFQRTAIPTSFGSQLRAVTGNYTTSWVRLEGKIKNSHIPPLPTNYFGDDGEIKGSAIALYGCRTSRILEVLDRIVLAEDLPHPTHNGHWFRAGAGRQIALRPYYEIGAFDAEDFDQICYLTRRMGGWFIYADGGFSNFQGDFRFKNFEDSGYVGFKEQIADKAAGRGLVIGAHSRTAEIDPRLSIVRGAENVRANAHVFKSFPLLKPLAADQLGELPVEPGSFSSLAHMIMIDDEIILLKKDKGSYKASVESGSIFINTIVARGKQGTQAAAHEAGAMVSLLSTQADQLYANIEYLHNKMLPQFLSLCNEYGFGGIGWDGNLSMFPLGYGSYLHDEIADRYYWGLNNPGNMYWSGAQITQYVWHFTSHRGCEAKLANPEEEKEYTTTFLAGIDYQARNFMMRMVGVRFDLETSVPLAHWYLSKIAAWNCGFRLRNIKDNPNCLQIMDVIREWTIARDLNAFAEEQLRRMGEHDTYWRLVPQGASLSWRLEKFTDVTHTTLVGSEMVQVPGVINHAKGVTVKSSCPIDSMDLVNDNGVALDAIATLKSKGPQYVQLDLGSPQAIDQIRFWHSYEDGRRYKDVVVQLSEDPDFNSRVSTIFNNDHDNSAGQGTGSDAEYSEPFDGKTVKCPTTTARYVRLWSNGSDVDQYNHYGEIQALSGQRTYPGYIMTGFQKADKSPRNKKVGKKDKRNKRKVGD